MSQKYEALPQAESALTSPTDAIAQPFREQQTSQARWLLRFWMTTTVFFALLSAWLTSQLYHESQSSSFARGFRHELSAAKHLIKTEERMFVGSPRFREDGTEYVPAPADGKPRTQYVGDPSEEIDDAWDVLHQGDNNLHDKMVQY